MKFGLSEEQRLLVDSIRGWLGNAVDADLLAGTGSQASGDFRREATPMGVTGALVPSPCGGSGLGLLEAVLVSEQMGWAAAPINLHAGAVMASLALAQAGGEEEALTALATGAKWYGVGLGGPRRDGAGLHVRDGLLYGCEYMVSDCPGADAWIVGDNAVGLFLVEAESAGVNAQRMSQIDESRVLGALKLEAVKAKELLPAGSPAIDRILDAGRIALAADTLGCARRMLQRAVDYAGEREQFGRAIASFQAVKHLCAEMAARIEPCHALLWYAAYAWDQQQDDAALLACHLKAHLAEVGAQVARTSTEVHGGIGFTAELGLHRWFKRIGLNRQWLGGPETLRHRAAQLQGWVAG